MGQEQFDEHHPLFQAVENREIGVIISILSSEEEFNQGFSYYGAEPLFLAVDCDRAGSHIEILKLLISRNAFPLNDTNTERGMSLIHQFVISYADCNRNSLETPSIELLNFLLRLDIDINSLDHYGMTPLDRAIAYGEANLITYLKNHGGENRIVL